jgi:4a-hydroxytetrahydrobiopterin dehydratase
MSILSKKEIQHALKKLNEWNLRKKAIEREFRFVDFVHAIGFVNSVALLAERVNHHPDIIIQWNKVMLVLSTHSEGGITKKDIAFAKKIDRLRTGKRVQKGNSFVFQNVRGKRR